jgi:catechol 2,3-dioxygenase
MRFGGHQGVARRSLVDTWSSERVARGWPGGDISIMNGSTVSTAQGRRARLPADARVGRVRLRVGDLERSLHFYRDVLGLSVARDSTSLVVLGPAGGKSELIELEERPGIRRRPQRPVTTGLYHVALLIPGRAELGRALLGIQAAGYPLRGMSDHAVSESLYLDDPDGNGLEIYADRPRSEWPIKDGVVQMTVDPMDVAGVLAAAASEVSPWRGLPAGTTVGHVHFTVSNLARSVEFYRDVIGFDLMMRVPSLAAVSAGGYHHHLNLNTWAGEGAPRDSEQVAGLVNWQLQVPEAQERKELIDPDGIPVEIVPF